MGLITWIKELFNRFLKIFDGFIKEAFSLSAKIAIAKLKEVAVDIVKELASTDLSNEQKRKAAIEHILGVAKFEGIAVKDSIVNVLVELAVQYWKNRGEL